MVASYLNSSGRRFGRWLAAALLALAAQVTWAGPGFISSARVSGDDLNANIAISFNCKAQYLRHEPQGSGDHVRIYLDPTGICNGVSPLVANSRALMRPINSDTAHLSDLEYDGDSVAGSILTLSFSEPVDYTIDMSDISFELVVHVRPVSTQSAAAEESPVVDHRRVVHPSVETPDYAINLASFRRVPTIADAPGLIPASNQKLYYSEVNIDGESWYRLRLGSFSSADEASPVLAGLRQKFPDAWIGEIDTDDVTVEMIAIADDAIPAPSSLGDGASKVDLLMEEARRTMVAGDTSRAIQIYTKILQMPENSRQPEAQEYLALAREKNGQMAHAKAEYQRYLSMYPDNDGAARVAQRLAALLATGRQASSAGNGQGNSKVAKRSDWRMQTFFSQYYRRDANQQNEQEQIVSQSALYSDVNFDARRRGERFDFSSRVSAGYRSDFLDEEVGTGNDTRISYAYADLADAKTGWRGRLGRQSRNTGGVLGRFDGLNIGYQASERLLLNAVVGKPAYSASDGVDSSRSFYGTSLNFGPILENLDLGLFYIDQKIDGIQDRQAIGTEFRYFGTNQSLWGMIDYDVAFGELSSAFLQGSWRLPSRLSIHGVIDRRGSPFLSISNAIIGQPVASFDELAVIFGEDELLQLSQDRTPVATTFTLGLSYPISQKLQINADTSQSTIEGTPASGGVLSTQGATYSYYSTSLIASSLFKEGDVTIFGARYSDSDTTKVVSLTVDSRYPIGRTWRINPRLRVDRRQRLADSSYEWLYTPGLRIQYRRSQKLRVDLEVGKQFSQRETVDMNLDRESYFINLGYQVFF